MRLPIRAQIFCDISKKYISTFLFTFIQSYFIKHIKDILPILLNHNFSLNGMQFKKADKVRFSIFEAKRRKYRRSKRKPRLKKSLFVSVWFCVVYVIRFLIISTLFLLWYANIKLFIFKHQ